MIRKALPEDEQELVTLYRDSMYRDLPGIVRWALGVVPERVVVVEEKKEILASAYTVVCGYSNLWASYLAFKNETQMRNLVDCLMGMRSGRGLRNLYVFCLKESMTLRICLIARGFVRVHAQTRHGRVHCRKSQWNLQSELQDSLTK